MTTSDLADALAELLLALRGQVAGAALQDDETASEVIETIEIARIAALRWRAEHVLAGAPEGGEGGA